MSDHRSRPLTVLGATGSIGVNTLKVAKHLGIPVHAVTANFAGDTASGATQIRT